MRFKQFLEARINSYEHEPQDGDQLLDTLRSHCRDAMISAQAGDFIYRGSRSQLKSGVYDPGSGKRKSQNTSNFYTVFLDTNSRNRDFPKRSESFICSTNRMKAHDYARNGTLLTCFPFNNVDIGNANEDDFWDLELKFGGDFLRTFQIVDFNDFWSDMCDELGKSPGRIESLDDGRRMLRMAGIPTVMKALQKEGLLHGFDRLGTSDREIVDTFIDLLPEAYSYKHLGCKLTTANNLPTKSEVWFSGKCVAVTDDDMDMVREEFGL